MAVIFKKAQCSFIVYDWDLKTPADDATEDQLTASKRIFLANHVTAISFSKNMTSPSGTFEITLDNSKDWRSIVRRDSWATIYMSNDQVIDLEGVPDSKYVRSMCYIERVAERITEDEDGSQDVSYVVTGRDYGKIYEDTEIWFNFFKFESMTAKSLSGLLKLENIVTTDKLIEVGHKLFFSSKADILKTAELSEIAKQWLLPKAMLQDLALILRDNTDGPFYGHLFDLLKLSETNTTIPINDPLSAIEGTNAWSKLKEWSVEPLNELFVEMSEDGSPQLIYRPIPWGINQTGYPNLAHNIKLYKTLFSTGVHVSDEEITFVDVGEDAHNRYNHFFAWSSAMRFRQFDNVSELKGVKGASDREFPYVKKASVLRHGFKPMHTELNTITYSTKNSKNGNADRVKLHEYNEVLYDYWSPAVYFESGSVTIVGRNDVKLGKAIVFDNTSKGKLAGKMFYIEGYSDEFVVEEDGSQTWFQTLQLTRGVVYDSLNEDFTEADLEADQTDIPAKGTFVKD